MQDSRTSDLIFGIPALVAYITTVMTMEPGDIVLTGTPLRVGMAADPPRSLSDGDTYEASVEGLGSIANRGGGGGGSSEGRGRRDASSGPPTGSESMSRGAS